jgi:hypothetical protein
MKIIWIDRCHEQIKTEEWFICTGDDGQYFFVKVKNCHPECCHVYYDAIFKEKVIIGMTTGEIIRCGLINTKLSMKWYQKDLNKFIQRWLKIFKSFQSGFKFIQLLMDFFDMY